MRGGIWSAGEEGRDMECRGGGEGSYKRLRTERERQRRDKGRSRGWRGDG